MALTSLQVCMDSSDWLQETIHDDSPMDSSSPTGDMFTCPRPLMERRLRPQHDQALKCPRCDSTHTKFCYYNNYSLTQPRYFCKTCRRYWTKGGTLRNVPVGGGCRKNKKVSTKKSNDNKSVNHQNSRGSSSHSPTDLQLSFPEVPFSHLTNLLGNHGGLGNPSFLESKYNANAMLENPRPIDFMESRYEGFMGNGDLAMMGGLGHDMSHDHGLTPNFHGLCSPFGEKLFNTPEANLSGPGPFMDTYQRIMLPYEEHIENQTTMDVKPNTKLLAIEWHDQECSDAGKDSFGYLNSMGSWTGLMNEYGQD
ncbi:unnamed protein product [Camellia sinensis]